MIYLINNGKTLYRVDSTRINSVIGATASMQGYYRFFKFEISKYRLIHNRYRGRTYVRYKYRNPNTVIAKYLRDILAPFAYQYPLLLH